MAEIHGICPDRFGPVREALAASLEAHDVGACVAVYVDGEPVVDIWGGYADAARTIPWERDTITNVWSTTKTMTALCALILADRGQLDLDAPVARYWPEFAAAGKADVRVRHLLSHTAGLPTWDEPMTVEDLYDWDLATGRLAAQAPRWAPGTAAGNARSVGAVQSVLACGGTVGGVRLLSPAGCERALEEQYRGPDRILGTEMRYGMGYGLNTGWAPSPRTCFWGGWGGSLVLVDLDARVTVSYVMSQMLEGDSRALGIVIAAYEGLSRLSSDRTPRPGG